MSVLHTLEQTVFKYIKDKIKVGSLSREQISEVISIEMETLKALQSSFSAFDKSQLIQLNNRYREAKFNRSSKHDISSVIPSLTTKLSSPAVAYEKAFPFGAAAKATGIFISILMEINKNLSSLFPEQSLTIFECKISNVMLLGILREADLFCKMTTILWGHFTDTVTGGDPTPLGYRAEYVHKNLSSYIEILNDVHTKEHNFSFLKDVGDLKKKNSDMILYANNQSFLNFLNPNALSKNVVHYLQHGIFGFGIFTWILSLWDDWRHVQYLRNKDFKEWLENRAALLRLELNGTNPNSPEYQKLVKIIQAYDAKIVEYDRKLANYEKE